MHEKDNHPNCVVLREAAGDMSDSLRELLHKRNCKIEIVRDPHRAFGRICLIERLESVRAGWGLERTTPLTLVIDGDIASQLIVQLLDARDRFLPATGILHWRHDLLIELRAGQIVRAAATFASPHASESVPSAQSAPSARARDERSSPPGLHLVEPPDDQPRIRQQSGRAPTASDNGEDESSASRATISPDEVRMLLDPQHDRSTT